ncbi:MAG: TraR/DksA family transcriptional regulator [Bernardetiaceae bacterium]|nr:TraR/DksA family transcriptional regulator [Bernardetiaceae bacterium]
MAQQKEKKEVLHYSQEDLREFEVIINEKLAKSRDELEHLKSSILRAEGESNRSTLGNFDDGADALEKEQLNQLAARTQKFIAGLERALFRIKNGTYGICIDTGKLIPKERLRAVPHTQQCIEAKMNRK